MPKTPSPRDEELFVEASQAYRDGYYSLEHCKENVTAYFEQFQPEKHVYGFLPEVTDGGHRILIAKNAESRNESTAGVFLTEDEDELAKKVVNAFVPSIDATKLLADAQANQTKNKTGARGQEDKAKAWT